MLPCRSFPPYPNQAWLRAVGFPLPFPPYPNQAWLRAVGFPLPIPLIRPSRLPPSLPPTHPHDSLGPPCAPLACARRTARRRHTEGVLVVIFPPSEKGNIAARTSERLGGPSSRWRATGRRHGAGGRLSAPRHSLETGAKESLILGVGRRDVAAASDIYEDHDMNAVPPARSASLGASRAYSRARAAATVGRAVTLCCTPPSLSGED